MLFSPFASENICVVGHLSQKVFASNSVVCLFISLSTSPGQTLQNYSTQIDEYIEGSIDR